MSQFDPLPPPLPPLPERSSRWRGRSGGFWLGAVLVAAGAYFLLANLGLLNWLNWHLVWPVVLIGLGLYLVIRRLR
ncbi:MAG: hypothetical protein E6I85_12615 [Chloroflexi bacterium]|nr:MAG: hypothetical protein E6I85_12615 [Chloroflexota bacterium]